MSIDRINLANHGLGDKISLDRGSEVRPAAGTADGKDKTTGASTGEDSVALSTTAKEIDRLVQVAEADRTERIDRVRAQIEDGSYAVSGEAVAQKLININTR